ncbi:aminotransferase class I/II-fold pyridoxal phosphate-dependent enzyme [Sporosarcina luteola]|uniref:aminotransferase class I/II-fold pyridoxal phosphate-dependent enzyme n=1 Tax=Sporosarcina luteola TaxID=582850 RepID=UPI0020402DB6|nr:aminotransferase class I/II-fold pyridoxal phosphate-dependent enzyme [Sporosarcina luteola]MCM3745686.1 aminotransferase class I/II-fold pyridoxal phosphate-dependent enzyme [Sporosarcina luteola]
MSERVKPLVQALSQFKEKRPISFHVPGHKHGLLSGLPEEMQSVLSYDMTELEGLDDLHEPSGVIREAEQRLSALYKSDRSFYLVNGSTVGNLAMMYAACRPGDTVIVQRNAHKSIFHAIELTGAKPVFVSPTWDAQTNTPGAVRFERVQEAIEAYPHAKAVVLTYPTYYGVAGSQLLDIIQYSHSFGIPVLVDEAHGAHFVTGGAFPPSALELGADVVVHSAHKTLPAMTMASFLHIRSAFISPERVAHYLGMLQSSSPSYLLMASLDDARAYAESYTVEDQADFLEKRRTFINELLAISALQIVETDDPLKILLRVQGYTGFELLARLEAEGVFAELADPFQVLLILPLLKKGKIYPFGESVQRIMIAVAGLPAKKEEPALERIATDEGLSTLTYLPQELHGRETEWRLIDETVGHVAAAAVIPYPPGIPLLLGGETVTERHVATLFQYLLMRAKFQGAIRAKDRQIQVIID